MGLKGSYLLAKDVVVQIEEDKDSSINYVRGDIIFEANYDELEPKYSNYNLVFNLSKKQPFSQLKHGKLFRDKVFLKDLVVKLKEFSIVPKDLSINKNLIGNLSDQSSIMQNDFAVSLTIYKSNFLTSLIKYVSDNKNNLKSKDINQETKIIIDFSPFSRFKSSIQIEIDEDVDFNNKKINNLFIESIKPYFIEGTSINIKFGDIDTLITINNENIFIGNNEENQEQIFSYEDIQSFYKNLKKDNNIGMKK